MTAANSATPTGDRQRLEAILDEREIDYLEIVWGQFRKNRVAVLGLWLIGVLFAMAIFAPVIACHVPFVYQDESGVHLPWYRYQLNIATYGGTVDFVFNMVMFLLMTWIPAGVGLALARVRTIDGRRFALAFAAPLAGLIALAALLHGVVETGQADTRSIWPGYSLQLAFFLLVAWFGQGLVRWRLSFGRRTGKRRLQWQALSFLACLVVTAGVFRSNQIPGTERYNLFHPTYDEQDIQAEDRLEALDVRPEGEAGVEPIRWSFWPPVRHSYLSKSNTLIPPLRFNPPPTDPGEEAPDESHIPIGRRHLLGTGSTGYDKFSQLIYGARVALTIGFVGVGIYLTIGVFLGALAGYFGGWVDILISRFVEIMITFPSFFLILILVGLLQDKPEVKDWLPPIFLIMFVIGIVSWTGVARLTRGEFMKLRNREFVLAARALGVSNLRIMFRHILPNAIAPALVAATFGIGGAILTEGALSFLGIGIDPPVPSWGKMLRDGYDSKFLWLLTPPAFMIFLTVTAYNLVGEGLRDSLDPHLRK